MIPDENQGEYDAIMASKNIKGSQGRGEIRPHRSLSDEEISCLFSMLGADQSPKGLRDMAMLSVMRGVDYGGWKLLAYRLNIFGGLVLLMGNCWYTKVKGISQEHCPCLEGCVKYLEIGQMSEVMTLGLYSAQSIEVVKRYDIQRMM